MPAMERAYTDEQLPELLSLISSADSVELKVTVHEDQQVSAAQKLGLDPLEAQLRQVYFFDTPDLTLNQHGVVVRARRIQKRRDDSVIKLRPVIPSELPKRVRNSAAFNVEVDALPGGFVCSGAMKQIHPYGTVRSAILNGKPLRKLFNTEQRALFDEHAPEGVKLNDLAVLGPVFVLKLKHTVPEINRELVAEVWLYPDGSRILELSTKCAPPEAFQVAAEARGYLASRGLDLSGEQQTKTRKALDYFASTLRGDAAAA